MSVLEIAFLVLLFLFTGVVIVLVFRLRRARVGNEAARRALHSAFALHRQSFLATTVAGVLTEAMQASRNLLGAQGVSFTPLEDVRPSLPVLSLGDVPRQADGKWKKRLRDPVVKHACKTCKRLKAEAECVLLDDTQGAQAVWCMQLHQNGRTAGMLSFFFGAVYRPDESAHIFLGEMGRSVALALDAVQAGTRSQMPITALDPSLRAILDERTRLAREIHDGIAQTLAFLKMEAARMQAYLKEGQTERVAQSLQSYTHALTDAYLEVRQAIDDLHQVPDMSFAEWLQKTAADFEIAAGVTFDLDGHFTELELPQSVQVQLMRIIQEALTNIRKHAGAKHVNLSISQSGETIHLAIQDDGRGFNTKPHLPASSYGLRSMQERADSIRAGLKIDSSPGKGTTLELVIPVNKEETP